METCICAVLENSSCKNTARASEAPTKEVLARGLWAAQNRQAQTWCPGTGDEKLWVNGPTAISWPKLCTTEWDFRGGLSRVGRKKKEREKILVKHNRPVRYFYCHPKSNRKVSAEHSPQFFCHNRLIWNCQHKHLCPDHPALQYSSSIGRANCRGPTPVSCHHITLSFLLSMLPFSSAPYSQSLSQRAKKVWNISQERKKKKNRWNSDFVS